MKALHDFNALERAATRVLANGRVPDAIRVYFFMADGDPSLDGGYLGRALGEAYDRMGNAPAAYYWYGRAIEENPQAYGTPESRTASRRRELERSLNAAQMQPSRETEGDRLAADGRYEDALRIYLLLVDGDVSLEKGRLGLAMAKCYDHLEQLPAAKYFYGRALEENFGLQEADWIANRREKLAELVDPEPLLIASDYDHPYPSRRLKPRRWYAFWRR